MRVVLDDKGQACQPDKNHDRTGTARSRCAHWTRWIRLCADRCRNAQRRHASPRTGKITSASSHEDTCRAPLRYSARSRCNWRCRRPGDTNGTPLLADGTVNLRPASRRKGSVGAVLRRKYGGLCRSGALQLGRTGARPGVPPQNLRFRFCRGPLRFTTTTSEPKRSTIRNPICSRPADHACLPLPTRWKSFKCPNRNARSLYSRSPTPGVKFIWMEAAMPITNGWIVLRPLRRPLRRWRPDAGRRRHESSTKGPGSTSPDIPTPTCCMSSRNSRGRAKDQLRYEAMIDDPGAYARPWTVSWNYEMVAQRPAG